ncbi:speckle-type POZ protein B-like [Oppia nitens]|uniref:speckle-type POZ protein B-like n=1 Tax=Oppia nitens TaxID=1686743 RepID=UPI0023DC846A|nr:speckle-type POZ protein B-like [Oppia nitens]
MSSTMDNNNNKVVYKTRVVFKVMDFAKQLDTNWTDLKSINSDKFMIGSDEWYCSIEWTNKSIGLYLQLSSSNEMPIKIQYEMSVIDNNNQLFVKQMNEKSFEKIKDWSFLSLITRKQLLDNKDQLLMDNTLTFGIDITVQKMNNIYASFATNNRRFGQLFRIKEFTDCRLVVGKDQKEFFASKLLLSSKSVVFEKMFTTDCKEKSDNKVVIDDVNSDVFEQFLQYIYTETCDKLVDMCEDLLYMSDKYMIEPLKTICLNLVYLRINSVNALKTYKLLKDFGADEDLMKKVNQFIGENITSVISKELSEKYGIDSKHMTQIVDHFAENLPTITTKVMFYTYFYLN